MQARGPFQPLVTVAIPTFNRATTFLPACLASARSQTYPHLEILVADNASLDSTRALMESLDDPRIRYHRHPENLGSPRNMNFCIQAARGEYIVMLPDDDLLDPDFVAACVAKLQQAPGVGLVRTGSRVVNAEGGLIREMPNQARDASFGEFLEDWITGITAPYQCCTLFNGAALKRVGLHSRHYLFDDAVAHFKVAAELGALNIREIKATFRIHSGELTENTPMQDWCAESLDLLELMVELCPAQERFLRTKGGEFLALANFRRALRRPWRTRPLECIRVFRAHHFTLPSREIWLGAARRRIERLIPNGRR